MCYKRTSVQKSDRGQEIEDMAAIESQAVTWIRQQVRTAGASGVVVPMSGGLDSSVTATLAVEALGSDRVLGLGLPSRKCDTAAMMTAETVADHLGISFRKCHLRPLLRLFDQEIVPNLDPPATAGPGTTPDRVTGNVIARLRMVCAYYVANRWRGLVLGTANRSELLLGYFTKYGDGAADVYPLGDLYKTEVRCLADSLGLPEPLIEQEPTAGLVPGQTDADDLGASYDTIDPLLRRVVDEGEPPAGVTADIDIDPETATRLVTMVRDTAHKRGPPPSPGFGDRDRNPDQS